MTTTMSFPTETLKAHLALNVRSLTESLDFYRKMLGIEPSKVRTGYAKFDVQTPPLNLTLNEYPVKERGALSHLGIQVSSTEDVEAVRARWVEQGLITLDENKTDCCYAIQDKTWVHDPDGNAWEVFVVLEDNLPESVDAAGCCATGHPDTVASKDATESGPDATCSTEVDTTTTGRSSCGCSSPAGN